MIKLNNTYYLLRHGEALSNVKRMISSWPETFENPLTDYGKETIEKAARELKNKKIDLIFSSDLLRARQTAEIAGKELHLEPEFDTRLREIDFGMLNGKTLAEWHYYFKPEGRAIRTAAPKGESYYDVLKRVQDFLQDIDKKYSGKSILIISHQCPLWILQNDVDGFSLEEGLKRNPEETRIGKGQIKKLN